MTLPWMAAKIVLRPVGELHAHAGNARLHSAEQIEQIKASMLAFGVFVIGRVAWGAWQGITPEALTMGSVGLLALAANVGVALLLYAWRDGDANMRGVWLCTRNDALGNLAVMAAALGVLGTGTAWPDLVVAAVMAGLAISGGWSVIRHARQELASTAAAPAAHGH